MNAYTHCSDARGRSHEIWCPGVGLVEWHEECCGHWVLAGFEPAPKPLSRGDANGDAELDISDAVATLGYLFLGEGYLACADAADSNDDEAIDISDPIHTLAFLFGGGRPLPPPADCSLDPTEDSLHCASYPPCMRF